MKGLFQYKCIKRGTDYSLEGPYARLSAQLRAAALEWAVVCVVKHALRANERSLKRPLPRATARSLTRWPFHANDRPTAHSRSFMGGRSINMSSVKIECRSLGGENGLT